MIHRACHRQLRFTHEASRETIVKPKRSTHRIVRRGYCPGCHHWIEKVYYEGKEDKVNDKLTGGDCYQVHLRALIDRTEEGLLCHGTVYHPKTGRHGHCWIERTLSGDYGVVVWCRDIANGHDVLWPRDLYYHIGQVEDVKRYTSEDAAILALGSGNHGPWTETEERVARTRMNRPVKKRVKK